MISSDCVEDDFLWFKPIYLLILVIGVHFICCPNPFNPVFQPTLYKFIVLGLLGMSPFTVWA